MSTNARTDVHAPASADFDPQAYDCYGCYDNSPGYPDGSLAVYRDQVKGLLDRGYRCGSGSNCSCGHCGTRIRYFALLVRDDVKQFIHVGEQCLGNRFALAKDEFASLRENARLNRERANLGERIEALKAEFPAVARLVRDGDSAGSDFLSDVRSRFLASGRLSDAQIAAVERAFAGIDRRAQWAAERAAEAKRLAEAGVRAPEGRVEVTGVVLSVKQHVSQYGESLKCVVQADAGWKVWSTVPASLVDDVDTLVIEEVEAAIKGKRVSFTATLARSDRDAAFAFAKRPTKAKIVA